MAYIEERKTKEGKTHFRVLIRLKGHPRISATFDQITDAKKWVQQTESAIREGRYFRTSDPKSIQLLNLSITTLKMSFQQSQEMPLLS